MRMCACQPAAMLSFARATDLIHTVLSPMCHERRGAGSTTGKPAAMHDTPSVRVRRGVWAGRRIKKYPQRLYLSLVLARNIAMTTQAPAASSAPMKEADDCPVV